MAAKKVDALEERLEEEMNHIKETLSNDGKASNEHGRLCLGLGRPLVCWLDWSLSAASSRVGLWSTVLGPMVICGEGGKWNIESIFAITCGFSLEKLASLFHLLSPLENLASSFHPSSWLLTSSSLRKFHSICILLLELCVLTSEGHVADLRDMMKRMLELRIQTATFEAKNTNSEIRKEEEEVETVEGGIRRPYVEPFHREERGDRHGESKNVTLFSARSLANLRHSARKLTPIALLTRYVTKEFADYRRDRRGGVRRRGGGGDGERGERVGGDLRF
ncbi:hypothetical protein MA16_Dca006832 [Dendrobium catenatum]|uniref:Uncharacterized protein n=1 Tax=Dendrobium catenatum TaxID=906689 RepID=A0A2I0VSX0_9ASPA|nr:hypothetical protein MA16_Dca006832 [Dendrobium catenatum]